MRFEIRVDQLPEILKKYGSIYLIRDKLMTDEEILSFKNLGYSPVWLSNTCICCTDNKIIYYYEGEINESDYSYKALIGSIWVTDMGPYARNITIFYVDEWYNERKMKLSYDDKS